MSDWEEYQPRIEVTSAFITLSADDKSLIGQIKSFFGWDVKSIDEDADGSRIVKALDPNTGEETETHDKSLNNALYFMIERLTNMFAAGNTQVQAPAPVLARFASWDKSFTDRIEEVAHEYADAKIYDKKAASGWMELANDNKRRADMIRKQINVEVTDNSLPYKSFNDMVEDVIKKKKFVVSRANASHPIWSKDQVVDFRIVHDVLGHVAAGADWSWFGMNRAFAAHAPLLSVEAQKALFTEVLGKGAFNSYYRSMAEPKIAFLKCFDEQQAVDNSPGHRETHPSQSPVPTEIPKIASIGDVLDPNHDFDSGVMPDDNNGFLNHRIINHDGVYVDPLNSMGLNDMAHQMAPRFDKSLNSQDLQHSVSNAFRSALTGRRRNDKDHATIYQAINHLPAGTNDPLRYYDAINADRNAHNIARGYSEVGKELDNFMPNVMQMIRSINPHIVGEDLHTEARNMLLDMRAEEEREVMDKLGLDASSNDIANEATRRMVKRLNAITKTNVKDDQDFRLTKHEDSSIYPSPLACDIKSMADIANHIENIAEAAMDDLNQGGKGHHFRKIVLQKSIDDVGPNEIANAWFHIAPHTSQIAELTSAIIKSLGHKPDDLSNRDHFKAERELHAGRDASGYNHMPLGLFAHGLHNAMHYENGHHPDRSHAHTLNPTKHYHVDWDSRQIPYDSPVSPGWWGITKAYRKEIGDMWDRDEGFNHHKDAIPFKTANAAFSPSLNFIPSFLHPETEEAIAGNPGQSGMSHAIESLMLHDQGPQAVWNQNFDLTKEVANSGT
jgi:hypothetical protein